MPRNSNGSSHNTCFPVPLMDRNLVELAVTIRPTLLFVVSMQYFLMTTRSQLHSYTPRLHQLDLLPVSYRHEYLDLVFLYKIINNHTYIDKSALPIISTSGITRSETSNLIRFAIPFAKTVT